MSSSMSARSRSTAAVLGAVIVLLVAVATWRVTHRGAVVTRPTVTVLEALGPGLDDDRFARASSPREFRFPDDHGPHPEFRNEWWYWTGTLTGPNGRLFGYQLTIFRTALAPDMHQIRRTAWAPRDIFLAHFTVSDVAAGKFYAFERTSRSALQLAGASAAPFHVWVLDWSAQGPALANAATPMRLRAATDQVTVELDLEQGKPPVLEGERGLSQKGPLPGNASYYYSLTRMPTAGLVLVGDQRFEVRGESWMDREWSTRALDAEQVGWDWFGLRFSDGRDFMFFHLRRRDGAPDRWSSGSLVERDGTSRHLAADDVVIDPRGSWQSPRSGVVYPASFRVRVPSADLDFEVVPHMPDQELDLTFRYWEGAVRVFGTSAGAPLVGTGYLELTGYADEPGPTR